MYTMGAAAQEAPSDISLVLSLSLYIYIYTFMCVPIYTYRVNRVNPSA